VEVYNVCDNPDFLDESSFLGYIIESMEINHLLVKTIIFFVISIAAIFNVVAGNLVKGRQ
jgi:hypothetical protein